MVLPRDLEKDDSHIWATLQEASSTTIRRKSDESMPVLQQNPKFEVQVPSMHTQYRVYRHTSEWFVVSYKLDPSRPYSLQGERPRCFLVFSVFVFPSPRFYMRGVPSNMTETYLLMRYTLSACCARNFLSWYLCFVGLKTQPARFSRVQSEIFMFYTVIFRQILNMLPSS